MAQKLGITGVKKIDLLYMMGITMITGALASVTTGYVMLSLFIVGGIAFVKAIEILRSGKTEIFNSISHYLWFGWSVFPVVFLLSPEGYGFLTTAVAMVAYLALDIFTKIAFYFNSEMK